jgi:hypothetical protein
MIEALIFGFIMAATLVFQAHRHENERKDLLNRIMARDLSEYQAMKGRPPPKSTNFIKKKQAEAVNEDVRGTQSGN